MSEQKLYFESATKLIDAMKSKKVSAVEVMETFLQRLDKINPILNGLVQQVPKEECLKKAFEADQKLAKGEKMGKLHGLPFTVKDIYLVKGLISCSGCTGLRNKIAETDSTVVSRLKGEGAIVLGITNVPEL